MIAFLRYLRAKFVRERVAPVIAVLPALFAIIAALAITFRRWFGFGIPPIGDVLGVLVPFLLFSTGACAGYLGLWACRAEALDGSIVELRLAARNRTVLALPSIALGAGLSLASGIGGLAALSTLGINANTVPSIVAAIVFASVICAASGFLVSITSSAPGLAPAVVALCGSATLLIDWLIASNLSFAVAAFAAGITLVAAFAGANR